MPRQENSPNQDGNSFCIRGDNNVTSLKRQRELFPDPNDCAAWFSGGFEIGGSQVLTVSHSKYTDGSSRINVQPHVELHSTASLMLDNLHDIYGGTRGQYHWRKGGRVAAEIVLATFPYTVTRREHALAMWNWLNATTMEEREELARSIQGREWQLVGNTESYKDLLKNPSFVAGALDSRAYISKLASTLSIKTSSLNVPLLNAFQSAFGGKVEITRSAGTVTSNGGNTFKTKKDTTMWRLTGTNAIKLIKFVSDFLQTPLPEGWNSSYYTKKQTHDTQIAVQIAEHVRKEIELLYAGEIPRISTNESLAKHFLQGRRAIWRALAQLTPEEQQIREGIVRNYAKRSIDATLARRIATSIQHEVLAFQTKKISSIRYMNDLAEEFNVSSGSISKHLPSLLDPELRSEWLHIIRSQSAHKKYVKEKNDTQRI